MIDESGETIEERGFARTRAPRYHSVDPATANDTKDFRTLRRDSAKTNKLIEGELIFLEFTNCECGPVDRKWRHNSIDARPIGQARVANGGRFVNATPDLADNALANVKELVIVTETSAGFLDLALNFDVNRTRAVHHDVGNVVAREKGFQRTVAEDVIADIVEQVFLLRD